MDESCLDDDVESFRAAGHELIDWIAEYFRQIEKYPVLSRVRPGEVTAGLPRALSEAGRGYPELLREFDDVIPHGPAGTA